MFFISTQCLTDPKQVVSTERPYSNVFVLYERETWPVAKKESARKDIR
jgi:hypothetical protein